MRTLSERLARLSSEKLSLLDQRLKGRMATAVQQRIKPRKEAGPCPLSFAQERLYFLDQLLPGSAAYNISAALPLSGAVDEAALEYSLNQIVSRHEALRTRFLSRDGEPVADVGEDAVDVDSAQRSRSWTRGVSQHGASQVLLVDAGSGAG